MFEILSVPGFRLHFSPMEKLNGKNGPRDQIKRGFFIFAFPIKKGKFERFNPRGGEHGFSGKSFSWRSGNVPVSRENYREIAGFWSGCGGYGSRGAMFGCHEKAEGRRHLPSAF
jgi:hypothetical protein